MRKLLSSADSLHCRLLMDSLFPMLRRPLTTVRKTPQLAMSTRSNAVSIRFFPSNVVVLTGASSAVSSRYRGAAAERVLYEDNHILAVYKPAGLPSQSSTAGDDNVLDIYKEYLKYKQNKKGDAYLGLIHRLDLRTSGIMVLGKTSKAARRLSKSFADRMVSKRYLCIVNGSMTSGGKCRNLIVPGSSVGARSEVMRDGCGAGEAGTRGVWAELECTPLCILEGASHLTYTLVSVDLNTGRKHQIRAQMAHLGHPIVGDVLYGGTTSDGDSSSGGNNMIRGRRRDVMLALHNYYLSVPAVKKNSSAKERDSSTQNDTGAGDALVFRCDPPQEWNELLSSWRVTGGRSFFTMFEPITKFS